MPKPKEKQLNHKILWTHVSVALDYLNEQNFGQVKMVLVDMLKMLNKEIKP